MSVLVSSFSVYSISPCAYVRGDDRKNWLTSDDTVEDCVSRSAAWSIYNFSRHSELTCFVSHDAPCLVCTEIWNEEFGASRDRHDVVRVRTLLTVQVGARAFKLQQGRFGLLREVRR